VLVRLDERAADPPQVLVEGQLVGELAAQRDGVDEEADQPLQRGGSAVRDGSADDDVPLSGLRLNYVLVGG
jgi:hypothetical protein